MKPVSTIFLCGLVAMVAGSPLGQFDSSSESIAKQHVAKRDLEGIRETYRGIHWDDAATQCEEAELNIIAEATRMALDVAAFEMDGETYDLAAWNRYFVKDSAATPGRGWTVSLCGTDQSS